MARCSQPLYVPGPPNTAEWRLFKASQLHFHTGFRQPPLQAVARSWGTQSYGSREGTTSKLPPGLCSLRGWSRWNPCSWQQGLACLPSQSCLGHPLMSTSFSVVSWVSQLGPASWMSDFEFLIMFISNKWITLFFFLSQLLKILCLNICQGLGISWIGAACQDIIFSLIFYTVIILILKQLNTSYNHFHRLVVAANSKKLFYLNLN